MPNNIEIIAALVIPLAVLTVLRINAAMVFLSLCLGYVLVEFVAKDTDSLISFVAPDDSSVSATTLRLVMLLLPVVLTSIIMVFSVHGRVRTILNFLPAAGVAILMLVLAVPLLTPGLRYAIEEQGLWRQINDAQAMVVGISAFISLLFLWTQRRSAERMNHHKRH
ncbi:MAG TPA: hypothetical protein VFT16_02950 [Candidatus Saccharimonadales bacterium]|nr:hypothetical protein [Candidatus Saccharimonadales bacterium]